MRLWGDRSIAVPPKILFSRARSVGSTNTVSATLSSHQSESVVGASCPVPPASCSCGKDCGCVAGGRVGGRRGAADDASAPSSSVLVCVGTALWAWAALLDKQAGQSDQKLLELWKEVSDRAVRAATTTPVCCSSSRRASRTQAAWYTA
uniref:Uncharacterized protein n=1 Tax=Octactis speculum TaxID=3111310 RepID=A0A7S2HT17_9STRA